MSRNEQQMKSERRWMAGVALAGFLAIGPGCTDILAVDLPGEMTETDLLQPSMMNLLVTSAIADFECSYSEWTASIGGLEDTFWESTGWFTRQWAEYQIDAGPGTLGCGTIDTSAQFYMQFQTSRLMAEQAYANLQEPDYQGVTNRERLMATAAVYAGYVYGLLGEHFCEMSVDLQPQMTPQQTLAMAEQWFDRGLTHLGTTGDFNIATTTSVRQMAHLGRARVRLAQGNKAGAAADAAVIQPGFVAWVTRDATVRKRWNQVHQHHTVSKYSTVAGPVVFNGQVVSSGYRNLTISPDGRPTVSSGVPDPRVPVLNTGQPGQDGVTIQWVQRKYLSHASPIALAKWAEAQLILAEVEGGAGAVARINAIRDSHGLPRYTGSTAAADIRALIIEERRREFFYEGRYHADKLRYDLWFPRSQGFNHKGVAYGPTTCLPMPESEYILNPNARRN
jgi:hypothetical protein